jgi:hypothetical protein
MAQVSAVGEKVQVPSPLQTSLVQGIPSSQVYAAPPQVPAVHTSFLVQAFPSLHELSSTFRLHVVWLVPDVHCWHGFCGFVSPSA